MTFDHQIDVEPAAIGPAAMALKAERPAIVREELVARAFCRQYRTNNSDSLYDGGAPFGAQWATPWRFRQRGRLEPA